MCGSYYDCSESSIESLCAFLLLRVDRLLQVVVQLSAPFVNPLVTSIFAPPTGRLMAEVVCVVCALKRIDGRCGANKAGRPGRGCLKQNGCGLGWAGPVSKIQ